MKKLISSAIVLAAMTAAASPAYADGGLGFQIAGDTFGANYTITNTSTAGEFVTGFGVTLRSPFGFDTVDGGFGVDGSLPFSPVGGSGVAPLPSAAPATPGLQAQLRPVTQPPLPVAPRPQLQVDPGALQ